MFIVYANIVNFWLAYSGCIKKLNRFEIALNFAKQLLVSSFFMYIASLGTYIMYNDENNFSNSNVVNQGRGGVFSNEIKMGRARNLKALIIF